MQEISLFLPPYRSDVIEDGDDFGGSDVTHQRSNFDAVSGEPLNYAQSCGREDCDCKHVSSDAAEEKTNNVPDMNTVLRPEARWMCCLCYNNYPWTGRHHSDLCTYCQNHSKYSHSPHDCQLCFKYERSLDDESDWITYDRSAPSIEELRADSQLEPFVHRYDLTKNLVDAQQHPTPVQGWNDEFQRYLRSPCWDPAHQAYYRKHYDVAQGQWVFFDWLHRPTNESLQSRSDNIKGSSQTREPTNFADSSHQTSRTGASIVGTYSTDNPQAYESLDPAFKVRDSSFFKEGRVIAILFTEPAPNMRVNSSGISLVTYKEKVHTQVRRFIVVNLRHGFCFACPILTYGNKATKKKGVRSQEHAIAYSQGYSPTLLYGEEELSKDPICIVMLQGERPLSKESRICFGIHHPIQHNVKVKHIGDVETSQVPTLLGYWKMENIEFGGNPAEADAEASEKKKDPHAFHPKKNPHGFDAKQHPDGYHPDHNAFGYHPKLNPYGFHREETPHAYHPTYNQFGFHKQHNIIGYHPKKGPYGFHPDKNPHGYHPDFKPFCYHPELNAEGYHSRDNPQAYHPDVNRFRHHSAENPHGFHNKLNPYGYHDQHNPYGYHPVHSPQGYHPKYNPSAYHPKYQTVVPQQAPAISQEQVYDVDSDDEEEEDSDEDEIVVEPPLA
ncbi:hypothetical protein BKA63DRAFT_503622 [Paraphoma chrysanthemicola]|nr:hypothetical protein BKA63DRAFT_503622 [Paraphoma chrysanthemicola]